MDGDNPEINYLVMGNSVDYFYGTETLLLLLALKVHSHPNPGQPGKLPDHPALLLL